jgi:hypothetical protein
MPRRSRRQPPPTGSGGYQPATAATGQAYGVAGTQVAAQTDLPLPLGAPPGLPPVGAPTPPSAPGAGGIDEAPAAPPADPVAAAADTAPLDPAMMLDAPTARPDESLMAGADDPAAIGSSAGLRPTQPGLGVVAQVLAEVTGDPVAQRLADSLDGYGL